MATIPQNKDGNNIIVGPDYEQLMKSQSNAAIVGAFVTLLFNPSAEFGAWTLIVMIRNIILMIIIKTMLEDSKQYLDKLSLVNLRYFQYIYQYYCYSENQYVFLLEKEKWMHNGKPMETALLKALFETHQIAIGTPGTYYMNICNYLCRIIVKSDRIIINSPNISTVDDHIRMQIIHRNRDTRIAGASISRLTVSPAGIIKIEPSRIKYAHPTTNYVKLEESLITYMYVNNMLGNDNTPYCVNFDGLPGTGKTTFASHIAKSKIFNQIVICNLVQCFNTDFGSILTNIEKQVVARSAGETPRSNGTESIQQDNILLVLDEIDKYLHSYTDVQINKKREQARNKKTSHSEKGPSVVDAYEKLTIEEEDDLRTQIKNEFLDILYKLVDGHMLSDSKQYVIIFNTNHFEKLFENVDKRYDALRDRFQRYYFDYIRKPAVIDYLKSIKENFDEKIESAASNICEEYKDRLREKFNFINNTSYDSIPDDISITYRSLDKELKKASYDFTQMIDNLSKKKYDSNI